MVIGGANMDIKARSFVRALAGTSNPGSTVVSPGGVGRNIAENLARLGNVVYLISVVGRDPLGAELLDHTQKSGVDTEFVVLDDRPTGSYTAIMDPNGELLMAVSDMEVMTAVDATHVSQSLASVSSRSLIVVDGNLQQSAFEEALSLAGDTPVIFDPVSVPKATALRDSVDSRIFAIKPGRDELAALTGRATDTEDDTRKAVAELHSRGVDIVWLSLGSEGSLLSCSGEITRLTAQTTRTVDVTGAGDAMLAAFCHAVARGEEPHSAALLGQAAAVATIASPHTVLPDISLGQLESSRQATHT